MKALLPLNPKAPAFSSASSKEPYLLYPPPEISPAFSQHPHNFLYPHPPPRMLFFNVNQFHPPPPPPPHMFFFNSHFPFHPPIKKPAKVFSHGDVKARKPIKPFPRRVCYRKCLPPRLLKKQVWVTRNRNLSAKPLPVEDEVETPLAGKTSVMVRNIPNDFGSVSFLFPILVIFSWRWKYYENIDFFFFRFNLVDEVICLEFWTNIAEKRTKKLLRWIVMKNKTLLPMTFSISPWILCK